MSSEEENDNSTLLSACSISVVLRVASGAITVPEAQQIVAAVGRPVVRIGDGLTLLHMVAQSNNAPVADFLLKQGHPTELRTSAGETPLDQAAWRGSVDVAMLLLRAGADRDSQTNMGYTPLHRCAYYGHARLASLLCLAGATQTLRDYEAKQTPYEVAVEKGHEEIAKTLAPLMIDGENRAGFQYARNNPKHPEYRAEATEALWSLFEMEKRMNA